MFQNVYYYLVASLPELAFDQTKLPMSLEQFRDYLYTNLVADDKPLISYLTLTADNENLLNLLQKKEKPFHTLGNFSKDYLEEVIKTKEKEPDHDIPLTLEDYIRKFIVHYKNNIPVYPELSWKNQLARLYHDFVMKNTRNEFLISWLKFDRSLRNILAAFNVRKHNFSMEEEIVGDDEVADALMSVKAKDFGLSQDYDFVNTLMNAYDNHNLYERERQIDLLKWRTLEQMTTFNYFSVEVLLAYFIKLMILNRWIQLTEEQGRKVFEQIINKLQSSYEFPKEFVLNGSNR